MQIDLKSPIAKDARILIVDDTPTNTVGLERLLERDGYAICISMTDPRQAIGQFAALQPDLLLLDWHMKPCSGLEVLQKIKEHVPADEMPPVLVLTADSAPETRLEALAAGATDFLSKPIDPPEMLLRIRNLLQLRMLHLHAQNLNQQLEEKVAERTAQLERTVADLKEVQQQVIQQERLRALSAMAGGIAHDFNNTLTIIKGYSDMFLQHEALCHDAMKVHDSFKTIGLASNDAVEIVRRLREFYRPHDKDEEDRYPVDINKLVNESVQLTLPKWRTEAQAKGIFIEVETQLRKVPVISAVASELREVIMNLIFNAVDAMPQGGRIVLSTDVEEEYIRILVEDSGTGMTEETRRHCLEPFYTTKGERGTGLGLAITYGVIHRHGGIIRINTQLNHGTRFSILLPITEVGKEAEETKAPAHAVHPMKVLVVDDHPEICHILSCYLEQDAHTVVTAENGCEALEKFRHDHFDVVITDHAMPKMNGEQLACAIKEINPQEPVIVLTAYADQSSEHSKDVDLLIGKPPSLRRIREALAKVTPEERS